MTQTNTNPNELLPLTPAVFYILLALANGGKHGYAIMKEVAFLTDGAVDMGPGTLYGTIKRMLEQDLIVELAEENAGNRPRRTYQLTEFGQRVLSAECQRMANLVAKAKQRHVLVEVAE